MGSQAPTSLLNAVESCPMQKLMHILSGPWTFYILHVLRTEGPVRFGALRRRVPGISSKVLTERLRLLEHEKFIYRHYEPTVPPKVTYGPAERFEALGPVLCALARLAETWYGEERLGRQSSAGVDEPRTPAE
jgi:DNA-binding HxlR family transcriptional regulator